MWEQIKQLKEVLALMAGAVVVIISMGGLLMDWRISVLVKDAIDDKFVAEGHVSPYRMDKVEEDINDLEKNDEKLDNKIERVVGILLEE
jgi:hypothetical protein